MIKEKKGKKISILFLVHVTVIWNKHNFVLNDRKKFYLLLKSVIFLKCDCQQFHNLQQSEQPPLIIEHQKRLRHISLEIHVVAWDRQNMGLNRLTGSQPNSIWMYRLKRGLLPRSSDDIKFHLLFSNFHSLYTKHFYLMFKWWILLN
jgi:hypothetical protein